MQPGQTGDNGKGCRTLGEKSARLLPFSGTKILFTAPPHRPSPGAADPELPRTRGPAGAWREPRVHPRTPKEGSAEDALPQAASEARPARLPPKRSDLRILNREPDEADNCYLDGTLETETAAEAAALLPNNACLSATDIETAAIFLRANARMGGRIPARDSLPSFSRQCGRSETKSCSVCFPFEVGI